MLLGLEVLHACRSFRADDDVDVEAMASPSLLTIQVLLSDDDDDDDDDDDAVALVAIV